jgi:hypothetical protein
MTAKIRGAETAPPGFLHVYARNDIQLRCNIPPIGMIDFFSAGYTMVTVVVVTAFTLRTGGKDSGSFY